MIEANNNKQIKKKTNIMTLIILIIIILSIVSLIGGIFIGISYTVNELFKSNVNKTLLSYNKFLEKQVKI